MVGTIICNIGTINVKFYLLEIWYPHGIVELPLIYICSNYNVTHN